MKQIVRRVIDRRGTVTAAEYPAPHVGAKQVLVRNHFSLISSGTEMSTLNKTPGELAKQTLSDPWMRNAVKQTVLSGGLGQFAGRAWHEMITPREIGYSGAGVVLEVGDEVSELTVGDRVAFAATGHAELVAPTVNRIAPLPDSVTMREGAFVTVGAIAIQALRRAEVQFGETVVVLGLGLVGQLCSMIAKAAGCVVIGVDINPKRTALAQELGADFVINPREEDLERRIGGLTGKHGVDATLVCAASKSATVVNSAIAVTRKQGRVVLVGYVKLDIHPKNFLYKEIDLRYSRAYGPGGYHSSYEKGQVDYPYGYVRWTEQRNLAELVRLIEVGAIRVEPLIAGTFGIDDAQEAFSLVAAGPDSGVAVLLDYDGSQVVDRRTTLPVRERAREDGKVGVGIIGCGSHTLTVHLPNVKSHADVELRGLASATGKVAASVAQSADATLVTTDAREIFRDSGTDAVIVASSHASHHLHVEAGLACGIPMLVEKPLVLEAAQYGRILRQIADQTPSLALGLNRRYSSRVKALREWLGGPVDYVHYQVLPPEIPEDHWTLDERQGGGRLIAEAEHFIDLCNLLIGRQPLSVSTHYLGLPPDDIRRLCNFSMTVHYEGAEAHIVLSDSGVPGVPRERISCVAPGKHAVLEDFTRLTLVDKGGSKTLGRRSRPDMGHEEQFRQFVKNVQGEANTLIPWEDVKHASSCLFAAQESLRVGETINVRQFENELLAGSEDASERQ